MKTQTETERGNKTRERSERRPNGDVARRNESEGYSYRKLSLKRRDRGMGEPYQWGSPQDCQGAGVQSNTGAQLKEYVLGFFTIVESRHTRLYLNGELQVLVFEND